MNGLFVFEKANLQSTHSVLSTDRWTGRAPEPALARYLRSYVNYQQDDWVWWLLLAEFAYKQHFNYLENFAELQVDLK